MKIKRFYFYIGGYSGSSYAIEYKDNVFAYSSALDDNYELENFELTVDNPNLSAEAIKAHTDAFSSKLSIEPSEILKFKKYLERYCKNWKKKYSIGPICDGTYWECEIWIDNFRIKSQGHEAYPSNFHSFTKKLSLLSGGKVFQ